MAMRFDRFVRNAGQRQRGVVIPSPCHDVRLRFWLLWWARSLFSCRGQTLRETVEAADSLYRLCKRYSAGHCSQAGSPSVGRFGDSRSTHAKSSATTVVRRPRKHQPSATTDFREPKSTFSTVSDPSTAHGLPLHRPFPDSPRGSGTRGRRASRPRPAARVPRGWPRRSQRDDPSSHHRLAWTPRSLLWQPTHPPAAGAPATHRRRSRRDRPSQSSGRPNICR